MTGDLCFKAQALDNNSADQYQRDGRLLPDDELQPRQAITAMISQVARNGKAILDEGGVEVIVAGSRFLAQLYTEQRDEAGRHASILCCGEGDPVRNRSEILLAMKDFSGKIGRTLDPDHVRSFQALTLPKAAGHRVTPLLVLCAALLVAALIAGVVHLLRGQN